MANGSPQAPNGKLLWWILSLLTTGAMGVGSGALHTVQANSEHVAVLESQVRDTQVRLRHIEEKLDRLIEVRNAR
jgi:hypothetical protein